MALKDWKRKKVDEWRTLWTKENKWIHLDKSFSNQDRHTYQVGSSDMINPKTVNGHFRFFRSRSSALRFIRNIMRSH